MKVGALCIKKEVCILTHLPVINNKVREFFHIINRRDKNLETECKSRDIDYLRRKHKTETKRFLIDRQRVAVASIFWTTTMNDSVLTKKYFIEQNQQLVLF